MTSKQACQAKTTEGKQVQKFEVSKKNKSPDALSSQEAKKTRQTRDTDREELQQRKYIRNVVAKNQGQMSKCLP